MRRSSRPIRVFYAGTAGIDAYARGFRHAYPNRAQVLAAVEDAFRGEIEYVDHGTDPSAFLRSEHRIVFAVTRAEEDTVQKHVLTQAEMLDFAAASDFFINPPGLHNPHSHNVIEAMAAGSVPILSYGDLFRPRLVDMETCIAYRDIPEFEDKLRQVLARPPEEIERMRRNVYRYYDEHLAPGSFHETFAAAKGSTVTLRIHNSEVLSTPEYLRGRRLGTPSPTA